jgi:hypothetical protein
MSRVWGTPRKLFWESLIPFLSRREKKCKSIVSCVNDFIFFFEKTPVFISEPLIDIPRRED